MLTQSQRVTDAWGGGEHMDGGGGLRVCRRGRSCVKAPRAPPGSSVKDTVVERWMACALAAEACLRQ